MSLSLLPLICLIPIAAVDTVRLALERDSAFWFRLTKYSGYAVAFGCVLEVPETVVAIKRWWLLRFRGEDHHETTEERKSRIVPLTAVGLLIIVSGIVAETYSEGKVSDTESTLRAHEEQRLEADDFRLGQIQLQVSARVIPDTAALTNNLRPFKGQTITATSYSGDVEAWFLCTGFVAVSRTAGVNFIDVCGKTFPATPPITNTAVFGPNAPITSALYKVLVDAGIPGGTSMLPRGDVGHASLVLFVGTKPPPSGMIRYPAIDPGEQHW